MGTCNSAESPRKWGSFEYPQPPNHATTAALLERNMIRQRGEDKELFAAVCLKERQEMLDFKVYKYSGVLLFKGNYVHGLMCLCVHMRALVCTCRSGTFRSYVSVKGSKG